MMNVDVKTWMFTIPVAAMGFNYIVTTTLDAARYFDEKKAPAYAHFGTSPMDVTETVSAAFVSVSKTISF